MAENASPPAHGSSEPAALFDGHVMHARLRAFGTARGHRFRYRVVNLLLDLDQLTAAHRLSPLFAINTPALFSFHERDHGPRDGTSLRAFVDRLATAHGVDLGGGRVLLLCYPRLLGYVFNPLSVYFCYGRTGDLALVIYEVRNTFGAMHHYVKPVRPGELTAAGLRQSQDKKFYVSPFLDMAMRYHFHVAPPDATVKVRILEADADGPLLAATFSGRRRALSTAILMRMFLSLPLMTVKIIAAIHWEALRLWLKGAKLVPQPAAGATATATSPARAHEERPAVSRASAP